MSERQILHDAIVSQRLTDEYLAPELSTQEFIHIWSEQNNASSLIQFPSNPHKDHSISPIMMRYGGLEGEADINFSFQSIPEELQHQLVQISIGIRHCPESPLHGTVVLETLNLELLKDLTIVQILDSMGISASGANEEFYGYSQEITRTSNIRPSLIELLDYDTQQSVFDILHLSEDDREQVYSDSIIGQKVDEIVFAIIHSKVAYLNHDMQRNKDKQDFYKKKLIEKNLWPFAYEEFDEDEYGMRGVLCANLTDGESDNLSDDDLYPLISTYFNEHNGDAYRDSLPEMNAKASLSAEQYVLKTQHILSYADFQNRVKQLFTSELTIPLIPSDAQSLHDMPTGSKNIKTRLENGLQIGFFFSASSEPCLNHHRLYK